MIKAVIDIGTNSTRLLVAKIENGRIEEKVRLTTITRLGENLNSTGEISIEAAERTCLTVNGYIEIAKSKGAEEISVFGTYALREAANSSEILSYISSRTGLRVRVISGTEEAFYSFKGATSGFGPGTKMVVDIGGGSTEISIGDDEPIVSESVSLGCVTLTDAFRLDRASSEERISEVRDFVRARLSKSIRVPERRPGVAIFTGGTATTLAAVTLGLEEYDRSRVHLSKISRKKIREIAVELASLDAGQRSKFPVIERERLNVIAAGALILEGVLETFGVEEAFVSENDILDGYLIYGGR